MASPTSSSIKLGLELIWQGLIANDLAQLAAPVDVALPSAAAGLRNLGNGQTGDRGQMASQRLSNLLEMAITLSLTPKTSDEIRDLIRQMSLDNSRWGAPRVHGELLKLGIEVTQATVRS